MLAGFAALTHAASAQEQPVVTTTLGQDQAPASVNGAQLPPVVIEGRGLDEAAPFVSGSFETSAALFGDTPLIETPFSVGIITEGLMEDRRAFSAAEALAYEPSVSRPSEAGFYSRSDFAIRGFAGDNFNSYRLDGLPIIHMVEPIIDDKQRLEVLKGPAGLRYGFMPPGGAINFVRKRPTPRPVTSISADIDTFGSFYTQIDHGNTISLGGPVAPAAPPSGKSPVWDKNPAPLVSGGPTLGYRFVAAADEFDDFYDNAGGDRVTGSAFIEWKPSEDVSIWASISGQNRERNGYAGVLVSETGRILDTGVRTNTMQRWAHNRQEVIDLAVGADIRVNDHLLFRTSTSYGEAKRSGQQTYNGFTYDNGDFEDYDLNIGEQFWNYWSHHSHLEAQFDTGPLSHDFVIGGEYRYLETGSDRRSGYLGMNNVHHLRYFSPAAPAPAPVGVGYEYEEISFFATDTIKFTDWLSAMGGLRYGRISSEEVGWYPYDDSSLSPTAAIMIKPMEHVHTYVSYTQGMQQGGVAPDDAVNAGQVMGPLESRQLEAGVKAELLEKRLYGELAVFQIEQDLEYLDGSRTYVQNGLRVHEGIEFGLRGRLSDSLQAGFSTMFIDAVQEDTGDPGLDGRRPSNTPGYQATAWIEWEVPQIPGLALSLNTIMADKRYANGYEQLEMDNYALLNAGVRYRFQNADQNWTLRLYLENLTDERYHTAGWYEAGYGGMLEYGSPISATFSVQVEF